MAKIAKELGAAAVPPSASSNLRAFYAKGADGLTDPSGAQYNAVDGVILLPADASWYSVYIDCGWLEEKPQ
jgi:hypothetical protein